MIHMTAQELALLLENMGTSQLKLSTILSSAESALADGVPANSYRQSLVAENMRLASLATRLASHYLTTAAANAQAVADQTS